MGKEEPPPFPFLHSVAVTTAPKRYRKYRVSFLTASTGTLRPGFKARPLQYPPIVELASRACPNTWVQSLLGKNLEVVGDDWRGIAAAPQRNSKQFTWGRGKSLHRPPLEEDHLNFPGFWWVWNMVGCL